MSLPERDNANEFSSAENAQPRSSTLASRLARSDKPIFVGRHNRTSRSVFSKYARGGEQPISRPSSSGWMSSSGRGPSLGLAEAFQRTDEHGNFIPRHRLSPREGAVGSISDSRIPRTRNFTPSADSPSPPPDYDIEYRLAGRHDRAASMPLDSESDTGTRDGSPSPAPKDRRSRDESESDVSQISPVDGYTDDYFVKARIQEEKDRARMKRIMASATPVFTKRRVGQKVEETTRTLVTKTNESSFEAEPPIRPPRSWGSKARRHDAWMRKILSPDTSWELKDVPDNQASLERQHAGPDVPLPSVESLSANQRLTPPASRPASAQPNNGSPEKSQMWNADLDFTAHSLQIDTSPQLRVRSTKLDDIRDREIQTLTARAVASNRLEEIKERNSEDRSIQSETVASDLKGRGRRDEKTQELRSQDDYHEMTILEEEGEHIKGTPVTIFSRAAYEKYERSHSRSDSDSRERILNHSREGNAGRSNHSRDDSRELLRKLSRATSHSPAPAEPIDRTENNVATIISRDQAGQTQEENAKGGTAPAESVKLAEKPKEVLLKTGNTETKPENYVGMRSESSSRRSALDLDVKRCSGANTPPKSDVDPEERITAEAKLFELQDNKSDKNSVREKSRSPSPFFEDAQFDETPKPNHKVDPLSLPTPRVTGAYIETPAHTTRKLRKARSISPYYEVVNVVADSGSSSESKQRKEGESENSVPPQNNCPRRQLGRASSRSLPINTAKPASVADDLRRIQQEVEIEDSTLDSFDALLKADEAASTDIPNNKIVLEPVIDLEYDEHGRSLSKKARQRRIEKMQLDRMSQSIKNTSSSIRDARHGIERLEEQVSSAVPHNSKSDDTLYVKIPVPRLWISRPPPKPGMKPGWKFTWLGLILTIFFGWYLSESIMCSQFCHPDYSTVNTWQPSDPFFPWAIPTKLDQWTGEVVSTTFISMWDSLGLKGPESRHHNPPYGGNDWWEGHPGPRGIKRDVERSIFMDETID